jgi:hypothetical protein
MAGLISVGSFVALGTLMAGLVGFPRYASPAVGFGLVGLSGVAVISGLVHFL